MCQVCPCFWHPDRVTLMRHRRHECPRPFCPIFCHVEWSLHFHGWIANPLLCYYLHFPSILSPHCPLTLSLHYRFGGSKTFFRIGGHSQLSDSESQRFEGQAQRLQIRKSWRKRRASTLAKVGGLSLWDNCGMEKKKLSWPFMTWRRDETNTKKLCKITNTWGAIFIKCRWMERRIRGGWGYLGHGKFGTKSHSFFLVR